MIAELHDQARINKSYFDATLDSKGVGRGGLREGFSSPSFLQYGKIVNVVLSEGDLLQLHHSLESISHCREEHGA